MTRIRPGRPADRPALAPAQAALADPAPDLLAAMLEAEGPGFVLVAVAPDPVGYLAAIPGPAVYVPELAVRPDRQREGHGSALLAALVSRHPDREVRLTVAADDETARAFYRAQGFEVVERLPDRFDDRDGLALRRPPASP